MTSVIDAGVLKIHNFYQKYIPTLTWIILFLYNVLISLTCVEMAGASRERPYHDKFIDLGFFYVTDRGVQKPQCVICYEVLSNESMKHHKLQRHLSSKHPAYKDRDRPFFDRKLTALRNTRLDKQGKCQQISENALEASYHVSLRIAKAKNPHTFGRNL